jgi:hypothetical protein
MTLRSLMREGRVVKGRGLQESQLPTFSLRGQPNFAWHRGGINQPGSVGSLYYTCTSLPVAMATTSSQLLTASYGSEARHGWAGAA